MNNMTSGPREMQRALPIGVQISFCRVNWYVEQSCRCSFVMLVNFYSISCEYIAVQIKCMYMHMGGGGGGGGLFTKQPPYPGLHRCMGTTHIMKHTPYTHMNNNCTHTYVHMLLLCNDITVLFL